MDHTQTLQKHNSLTFLNAFFLVGYDVELESYWTLQATLWSQIITILIIKYSHLTLCHFPEATAVTTIICLDQTGLKFKGDRLVDCMSIEQSTPGCKGTTCPVPHGSWTARWPLAPCSQYGYDPLMFPHWFRQANNVSLCLTCLHLPARVSTSIDTLDEDSKYGGPFIPTKAAHHAQKRLLRPWRQHMFIIVFLCLCLADIEF